MDDLVLSGPQACKYCKDEGKNKTKKRPYFSRKILMLPFFACFFCFFLLKMSRFEEFFTLPPLCPQKKYIKLQLIPDTLHLTHDT